MVGVSLGGVFVAWYMQVMVVRYDENLEDISGWHFHLEFGELVSNLLSSKHTEHIFADTFNFNTGLREDHEKEIKWKRMKTMKTQLENANTPKNLQVAT